jgi:hypothetical protein
MKKLALPFFIILVILLLSTCETFDPQWMGVWVDENTVDNVTIRLELAKWEGVVTVKNNDPNGTVKLTIVEGSLDGDEDTMLASITSLYQEYWDESDPVLLTDPILIYVYVTTAPDDVKCPGCFGLDWPCSVSYTIEGNKLTLVGPLISVLTDGASDTLEAIRKP